MPIYTLDDDKQARGLRRKSVRVTNFQDPSIIMLRQQMDLICRQTGVAGIAANQLGSKARVFALTQGPKKEAMFFFNPILKGVSAEEKSDSEGCLSVPGRSGYVIRAIQVKLRWQDENGSKFNNRGERYESSFDGFWARAVQHELDHLDGFVYTDKCAETFSQEEMEAKFYAAKSAESDHEVTVADKIVLVANDEA